jgi:hypothetical protein
MKIQIIGPDNRAAIDGQWVDVKLAAFPCWHPAYHAVFFDDDTGAGHIEWVRAGGVTPPNMPVTRDQVTAMFGPIVDHVRATVGARP